VKANSKRLGRAARKACVCLEMWAERLSDTTRGRAPGSAPM
jgi:hypothetical protein